jgi:hypothetical protein
VHVTIANVHVTIANGADKENFHRLGRWDVRRCSISGDARSSGKRSRLVRKFLVGRAW